MSVRNSESAYAQAILRAERDILEGALAAASGSRLVAADLLGIHYVTLESRMSAVGLLDPDIIERRRATSRRSQQRRLRKGKKRNAKVDQETVSSEASTAVAHIGAAHPDR